MAAYRRPGGTIASGAGSDASGATHPFLPFAASHFTNSSF